MIKTNDRMGWICPSCNTVYAPWVSSCACNSKSGNTFYPNDLFPWDTSAPWYPTATSVGALEHSEDDCMSSPGDKDYEI